MSAPYTEIFNALSADSNITAIVGDEIYHSNLSKDYSKPALLFMLRLLRQEETLDGVPINFEYLLTVKMFGTESQCVSMAGHLDNVLIYHKSATIDDLDKQNETLGYNDDLDEYTLTQEYIVYM
jgi:hypothetical protein